MNTRMNPLNAYRETRVKTASQGRLIVMLYDEAIKQVDIAIEYMGQKNRKLDQINNAILKAQDVVAELMSSLNFEKGGDLARNLFNLYMFFNNQLLEANLRKTPEPLVAIRSLLSELRDAWDDVSRMSADGNPPAERSLNVAG